MRLCLFVFLFLLYFFQLHSYSDIILYFRCCLFRFFVCLVRFYTFYYFFHLPNSFKVSFEFDLFCLCLVSWWNWFFAYKIFRPFFTFIFVLYLRKKIFFVSFIALFLNLLLLFLRWYFSFFFCSCISYFAILLIHLVILLFLVGF